MTTSKKLFRIKNSDYPTGLPGHILPQIGSTQRVKGQDLIVIEQYWSKTFYGPDNMYSAWTSGVQLSNGKYYHCGPIGLSDKPIKITWLTAIPEAHQAYIVRVDICQQIVDKLCYAQGIKTHWVTSNLLQNYNLAELQDILNSNLTTAFKEALLLCSSEFTKTLDYTS
ncbi:MAG: hypothetical protein EKK64_11100 [Neisseriaceae bacterium]|nr:MAG: hypothetical protein EKK64_11100 [Neisseriaceae bacterium]